MVPPRARCATTVNGERGGGEEPGATLSSTHAPRHHDHRDARDRGQRRGGLGDAEGQDDEHQVEPTAQRRRRGDDHVDAARRGRAARSPSGGSCVGGAARASRSTVTGKGLPLGHEPTVVVACEGARLQGLARDEPFERACRVGAGTRRRRGAPAPCSRLRSPRYPSRSTELNTGGSPKRPRRSTTHRARGTGRGAHAPVEEGQRRSRRPPDDGAGPASFADAPRELEGLDVVDGGLGQGFGERGATGAGARRGRSGDAR